MFSCLGRLGCFAVIALVLAGIVGWFTQDMWMPKVRRRVGLAPSAVTAEWQPVRTERASRGREALAQLTRRNGPISVQVQPSDLAAFAVEAAPGNALKGISKLESRVDGDRVYFRGNVNTTELGSASKSGPLAGVMDGMLRGDQQLTVGGRMDVPSAGHGVFHIDEVKIGELRLPAGAVRKLIAHYAGSAEAGGGDAVTFPLPEAIGDVKIQNGRITLYRASR